MTENPKPCSAGGPASHKLLKSILINSGVPSLIRVCTFMKEGIDGLESGAVLSNQFMPVEP